MAQKKTGSRKLTVRVRLKVREIAEQKGRSKTWLSHHAELQYDTIRGIFSNPERDVSIVTLEKIARALRVNVTDLYEVLPDEEG